MVEYANDAKNKLTIGYDCTWSVNIAGAQVLYEVSIIQLICRWELSRWKIRKLHFCSLLHCTFRAMQKTSGNSD